MNKEQASQLLDVKESLLSPFDEIDPYNNNQIKGYISHQSDHRYGTLLIYEVNGKPTPHQIIYCTPKLHYPFSNGDVERKYHWPKFKKVHVYEKLDGTNIFAYTYCDAEGTSFTTFKTRLTACLKSGKFGDFKSMWDDVMKMYPAIQQHCTKLQKVSDFGLSFEMYGLRNPLTIKYGIPIDARLLFIVDSKTSDILPPVSLDENIPALKPTHVITSKKDLTEFYNQLREEAKNINMHNEDGSVTGTEGFVFYVLTEEDKWVQFKCKPEDIEEIHWVNDSIPLHSIVTTTLNAIEDYDGDILHPDFKDHIIEMLREEYTEQQIHKSHERIIKGIKQGVERLLFREKVNEVIPTIDFNGDKGFVMRQLSKHFNRNEMCNVYNALVEMKYLME